MRFRFGQVLLATKAPLAPSTRAESIGNARLARHTTSNRCLGRQTKALSVRKPQLEPETRRQITAQYRANTLIIRPKYYLFSMFPIFFSSIEIMPFGMLTNSMKSGL